MTQAELLAIAERICTPKELDALRLAERGLSQRAIADALDISRSAVRARLDEAYRKIRIEKRKETAA